MNVNALLSNCKQNITSLSLLTGRTVKNCTVDLKIHADRCKQQMKNNPGIGYFKKVYIIYIYCSIIYHLLQYNLPASMKNSISYYHIIMHL